MLYYGSYYGVLMGSVVVSIRIPRELKRRLDELGVNVSEVVRKLLEQYVEEVERARLGERLERLRQRLAGKVDPETIARIVRESREQR